jgi:hypothetical protein
MCGEKLALVSLRLAGVSSSFDPVVIVSQYLSVFLEDALIVKEIVVNVQPTQLKSVSALQRELKGVVDSLQA